MLCHSLGGIELLHCCCYENWPARVPCIFHAGFAGLLPSKDTLFVADLESARSFMASELQLGIGGDWPDGISKQQETCLSAEV